MKMKGNDLLLSYVKDIANNISFLNETMALTSNLIAKDYKNKYDNNPEFSVLTQKQQNEFNRLKDEIFSGSSKSLADYAKDANFNQYGFPIYAPKKSNNSNNNNGSIE
ncbi:hypothetical protein BKH41_09480 [Helicobacter sp. 12S02232-10]|uniref:hypothetical protein n=1 Tax=Helicobacter sp. 12S02232-10 TaxID=1476197 RepID=UPI000BCCB9E8|nr:hypothetical protein [Helicobacter sp. 12S02232-10]PAF46131.1 hypothetical protein BKH41_09480 [Helicobacter sp. 12S02232-10]